MIKSATRRYANRRAEYEFNCTKFNKDGMNTARRQLDKALIHEALLSMAEPEIALDYYRVERRVWNEYGDWEWDTEGVYEDYSSAAWASTVCGGQIYITDRDEFDHDQMMDFWWDERFLMAD